MSLSNEGQAFLPTASTPRLRFDLTVEAGQTVVVTVGNHGSNPKIDYRLQLQLLTP